MPLYKRKPIERAPTPDLDVDEHAKLQVWQIPYTREIFTSYEEYLARHSLYIQPIWQCELTGKQNLTYEQALASELEHSNLVDDKFPEPLKRPILEMIQFETTRLDNLIDDIYEKFKSQYIAKEDVYVNVDGKRHPARVLEVKSTADDNQYNVANGKSVAESSKRTPTKALNDVENVNSKAKLTYRVQLLDGTGKAIMTGTNKGSKKYVLRNIEGGEGMSRDRLTFNKNILRKFIKDSATKDTYMGAPWMVKPELAQKYKIPLSLPDELQKAKEIAQEKIKKRKGRSVEEPTAAKKVKTSKEQKKRPRDTKRPDEDSKRVKVQKKELQQKSKNKQKDQEKTKAEKKRQLKIKYPIEDLEVSADHALSLKRPPLGQEFHVSNFENLIKAWNFFSAFGKPLGVSFATLDDFESALQHNMATPRCILLIEIHCALLNAIIKDRLNARSKTKKSNGVSNGTMRRGSVSASTSSGDEKVTNVADDGKKGITIQTQSTENAINSDSPIAEQVRLGARQAIKNFARTWDQDYISSFDGRKGWEATLVGCIYELGSYEALPQLDRILAQLVPDENSANLCQLENNFATMDVADKLQILNFLVDIVSSSSTIREYIEECMDKLSQLSKEKSDLNKERKKIVTTRVDISKPREDMPTGAETKELSVPLYQDEAVLKKQEEKIEKEIRRYAILRQAPLGQDRFYNQYFYFDGMGLSISEKYGTGMLLVRSPSVEELEGLCNTLQTLRRRRKIEQEEQFVSDQNGTGMEIIQWGYYEDVDEVDELLKWLNPKGIRELTLSNELRAHYTEIVAGMNKRQQDKMLLRNQQIGRRSMRTQTTNAMISHLPYMRWTNKLVK